MANIKNLFLLVGLLFCTGLSINAFAGPVCGDGTREDPEECDDSNTVDGDGCTALCVLEICGDNITNNTDEECDDGNTVNDDGCTNTCMLPACGDGIVNGTDECEDGNLLNGDGCSDTCQVEPFCGDGVVEGTEQCDDNNTTDGDGCSSTCQTEAQAVCGDGVVEGTEQCDDNNTTDGDGCSSTCQTEAQAVCGDGVVEGAEQCDDNNTTDGDGCSATCEDEAAPPACGDGTVDPGEACDDGNTTSGDGCSATCADETLPPPPASFCGDGTVDPGESCDDGNTTSGDGCSATCEDEAAPPACGDGTVDPGEEACDDGNTTSGDGCSATCEDESTSTDSNGDGISDEDATRLGLDPNDPDGDTDNDGLSDVAETGGDPSNPLSVDTDGDGIIDALEPGESAADASVASDLAVSGGVTATIATASGELLSNVRAADATNAPDGVSFPFGVISYTTTSSIGGSVTVRMTFSAGLRRLILYKVDDAGVYRVLPSSTWVQVNSRTVDLTLTDGDPRTDLDGKINGSIDDPVGVGSVEGSGGGGCTISTAARFDPIWLFLLVAPGVGYLRRRVSARKAGAGR